jgi:hypothetical protein
MKLTNETFLREINAGAIEVHFAGTTATFVIPVWEQFVCGDLYEGYPKGAGDDWYPDFPGDLIQSCDAMRVAFDNGSMCLDGHYHLNDAEYSGSGNIFR